MENVDGTVQFIEKVLSFWKIVSNKEIKGDERHREPLKKPIESEEDESLSNLKKLGSMMKMMQGKQGKRERSLTRDTSIAFYHTCEGFIELSKNMLASGFKYILLGNFTTDYLETSFGSLRQGSGGTYFITVQNVIQKFRIEKTRLLLHLEIDVSKVNESTSHCCEKCNYVLEDEKCDIFDSLVSLEENLSHDVIMALVYIT